MPNQYSLKITHTPTPAEREYIHQQIKAFNDDISEPHRTVRPIGPKPLAIFIKDEQEQIVGGLIADTYWEWLDVDDFWLAELLRKQGYGTKLLAMTEAEAKKCGCKRAKLKTFSFQARGFYEKMGYRVVGQLDDYPPDQTFYWMRKDFEI